jgi:hypothetical protein
MSARVVDKITSGGFAYDRDFARIDVVIGAMGFHPADCGIQIRDCFGESGFGREPVIDAEPGEPGIGQWLKERPGVRVAAAPIETSAVHENGGRKWTRAFRNVQVE